MSAKLIIPSIFTAIDKLTAPVRAMTKSVAGFLATNKEKFKSVSEDAAKVSKKFAIIGAAIAAPLIYAAHSAIQFEDRMADVAKTTGLAGAPLEKLSDDILNMSTATRTSIESLQKIAEIGGAMGVPTDQLSEFTDSVNKFNVALGADFEGGVEQATRAIAGMNSLFKETKNLKVAEAITRTGSAINALSSKGVQVPELTEFANRVGQLPGALKPTIQDTLALGAALNKAGVPAEIASRAIGDIFLTATQNAPVFAKQLGISQKALNNMLNTAEGKTVFLKQFATSLNGMDASKLGPLLKSLKLGDSGSLKTLGAIAANLGVLTEFQKISSDEFERGTSILNEYNTKNSTTAAKIAISKNNFEALSIMIGTQLLPVIAELIHDLLPIIKRMMSWVRENKALVSTLVKVAAGAAAFMFIISGVSGVVSVVSGALSLLAGAMRIVTFVQWLWNAALLANPIGLIIVGVIALIALITVMIIKWEEWGAAATLLFTLIMPPLGVMILLIQSFRRNWDMITAAFKEGGVLAGIQAIGATLLDAVLMPLEQILGIINQLTGMDWAAAAASDVQKLRKDIGINVEKQGGPSLEPVNNSVARDQSFSESINEKIQRQKVGIEINDNTGNAKLTSDNNLVPIKMSSTFNRP